MKGLRILIMDDEKHLRDMLRGFFEYEGFEVFEAADGMEASEEVREDPFDLVLTDLRMSGLDGLEVLKLVKSLSPETAVLILTWYPSPPKRIDSHETWMRWIPEQTFWVGLPEFCSSAESGKTQSRKPQPLTSVCTLPCEPPAIRAKISGHHDRNQLILNGQSLAQGGAL